MGLTNSKLNNYKELVESFWGQGTCVFKSKFLTSKSTPIVEALNGSEYGNFCSIFKKRLERLSRIYNAKSEQGNKLLDTIKSVAYENNWKGAYSELVAYDFFNSETNWLRNPIKIYNTIDASETLAGKMKNSKDDVDLDAYYDDFDVYFDVKTLSDKTNDILENIILEVENTLSVHCHILPQYPMDIDFGVFEKNRVKLKNELIQNLKSLNGLSRSLNIESEVVDELSYQLRWDTGILISESTYNPFLHAENHHTLLFKRKHTIKFVLNKPSLIVFVVFPWFSEKLLNFGKCNEIFYRSFSRRFFCQYRYQRIKAKELLSCYNGEDKAFDVTKKLSGVLFLEDCSLTAEHVDVQNIRPYAYLNPNADNKIVNGLFVDYIRSLGFQIDDFEYDNYSS